MRRRRTSGRLRGLMSTVWFRAICSSWRPKQFVACYQADLSISLCSRAVSSWDPLTSSLRIAFCVASWSAAALSEYICSNHVLSRHLDILKGHNLKPYRTDNAKERPEEGQTKTEPGTATKSETHTASLSFLSSSATCDMQCRIYTLPYFNQRHPKVAEIELKDNTKCQRRQQRSSTQCSWKVEDAPATAEPGGGSESSGATITFHWARPDNESPPAYTGRRFFA